MRLPKDEVIAGYTDELEGFEALIRPLDDDEWARPSRCAGWSVGDVAHHVIGTLTDIVEGRFDGLGTPEHIEGCVDARRGNSAVQSADELAAAREAGARMLAGFDEATWAGPAVGDLPGTVGDGVGILWYDTYVHAEDIRAALGRPSERGPGLRASVLHVAETLADAGWGPASLVLDGIDPVAVGAGGPEVHGDPLQFLLAATGRADPSPLGLDERVNIYR